MEATFWAAGNDPMQEQKPSVLCHLQLSPTLKNFYRTFCVCVRTRDMSQHIHRSEVRFAEFLLSTIWVSET